MSRLLVVGLWCIAGHAWAQPVDPAEQPVAGGESSDEIGTAESNDSSSEPDASVETEARTRFTLGQQLYEQGRFDEALTQFEAAHELSQRPGLLYNIYLAHRDLGNTGAAATALRRYLEEQPNPPNRGMLEGRLASLEEQASREREAARRANDAEERERRAVAASERNLLPPLLLSGGGVVLLGVAGGLGLANRGLHDDLEGRCYDGGLCLSEEEGEIDSLDRRNLTADVLMGIGAAVFLGGIVWLIISAAGGGGGDDVAVQCGPSGCGGRF